jgi:hypothetical protein
MDPNPRNPKWAHFVEPDVAKAIREGHLFGSAASDEGEGGVASQTTRNPTQHRLSDPEM